MDLCHNKTISIRWATESRFNLSRIHLGLKVACLQHMAAIVWEGSLAAVASAAMINLHNNSNNSLKLKLLTQELMIVTLLLKSMPLQVERAISQLAVMLIVNLRRTSMLIESSNIHNNQLIMYSGSKT
jgi:hypothetical protein